MARILPLPLPGTRARKSRVIRITELPLPLDYTPEALRQAVVKRLKIRDAELLDSRCSSAATTRARRTPASCSSASSTCRCADEAAVLKRFARDRQIGLAPDTTYHPVAKAPAQLDGAAARRSASGPAACSPRWCWRRWASGRSCSSAARTCASAPRTPGACGARRCSTPNPTCSSAKAAPALFSDGKLYSQIKDPKLYGRKVLNEFVEAGAPEEILYVSKPHIGTFRLVGDGREDARGDHRARRRDPLRAAGRPTC